MGWVREWCAAHNANLYVLALEDSCPFFLDRGFILETLPGVQRRLNGFTDTHLLRLAANRMPEPLFDDADADAGANDDDDDVGGDDADVEEVEGDDKQTSVASRCGSAALGSAESFIGDDAAVAAALAAEFAAADLSDQRDADADSEEDEDEDEDEEDQEDEDGGREDDGGDTEEDEEWSGDEEADEDEELRRAIALSRRQQ
jgi:hypothetical protein